MVLLGFVGMIATLAGLAGPAVVLAQESVVARAALVDTVPADDPMAPAWNDAPMAEFPLSPQVHWAPRIQQVTVKSVKVRALHDGKRMAILLEYADPTQDPDDAAALEFMVGDKKAHFAHGQPMAQVQGGPVNIWYWKNKDAKGVDMNAQGFGTLKAQDHQDVTAKGSYQNGIWRVVFARAVSTDHPDQDAQFVPGEFVNIAFAVWDGTRLEDGSIREKGSQKAISSWWYFRLEPPPDYSPYVYALLAVGVAAVVEFVVVWRLRKGSKA
ncbi:ethylbenzene dehydrogenase-related protein [Nitrospira sp. Kam-Ns4a]